MTCKRQEDGHGPGPKHDHDGRRERKPPKQAKGRHAKGQKKGAQETLALLLHFHRQQFQPVFPDGRQPPHEMFRSRGELPEMWRWILP